MNRFSIKIHKVYFIAQTHYCKISYKHLQFRIVHEWSLIDYLLVRPYRKFVKCMVEQTIRRRISRINTRGHTTFRCSYG